MQSQLSADSLKRTRTNSKYDFWLIFCLLKILTSETERFLLNDIILIKLTENFLTNEILNACKFIVF